VSESALTTRIKQARHTVGDDGRAQRVVKTVHGRGYRLAAPVDELVPAVFGEEPDLVLIEGFTTSVEV
jgi:DNA-binding winged helix-turn-helix (wHTH) protein